jgi:cytochrome c553
MKNAFAGIAAAALVTLTLSACSGGSQGTAEAKEPVQKSPATSLPEGDAQAGEKLAAVKMGANAQACVDCHGPHGNAPNAPDRPKIGGQYRDYIAHSLQAYRAGERSNVTMVGQAKGLSDVQIEDLAAYFSDQETQLQDLSKLDKH